MQYQLVEPLARLVLDRRGSRLGEFLFLSLRHRLPIPLPATLPNAPIFASIRARRPPPWRVLGRAKNKTTAPTIVRWKQRFRRYGLEGLDTYHPGQKPSVLTPALRARILSATRRKLSDGSTHWSCRKLASALGVSKDAVHRVWQEAGLKPHRLERYMASDDPEFESKAADILSLYLRPPQHAAVFCVDEKTAIQALDRLDQIGTLHGQRRS